VARIIAASQNPFTHRDYFKLSALRHGISPLSRVEDAFARASPRNRPPVSKKVTSPGTNPLLTSLSAGI